LERNESVKWKVVAAIVAAWVLVQIPFLLTAIRVDETNIIRIAEQIERQPSDPYSFYINWGGIDDEAFHILANPPGVPYWLALWGSAFGWSESVLHASMVPFGAIALLGFALLAREFNVDPRLGTLLMIASPAFFLCAQVVMPDIAMFAGFVVAMAAAMRYRRTGERWLVPLGFVAGALTPFLKYNGSLVGPLLAIIWLYGRGRRMGLFVIMAGPAVGLGAWSFWSLMYYGRIHLLTIAEFESAGITNIMTAVIGFFGLGVVPLVLATMKSPRGLSNGALHLVTALGGIMMAVLANTLLAVDPPYAVMFGVSAAIGFRFAVVWGLVLFNWIREKGVEDAVLLGWVAIVMWFQFGLLFASVRYLLPMLPPVILIILRHRLVDMSGRLARVGLAACIVLSVSVAIGDARSSNLYRRFVHEVAIPEVANRTGRFFFDGHWGFQYYMEPVGGQILNYFKQPKWQVGDVLVIARVPFPSYSHPTPTKAIDFELTEYVWSPEWPVRAVDCSAWANFYGPGVLSCKGISLPFGFSTKAADVFAIYRAKAREQVTVTSDSREAENDSTP